MQKSKERLISFFDVVVSAHTRGEKLDLAPFPLLSFMLLIEAWKNAGTCPKLGRKATETIYLADIKVSADGKRADLLINRSDKDASNVVYSNPESNAVRAFQKVPGEGNDFSAHLVINLKSSTCKYVAALEVAPGLPSGKITRFLTFLLRNCVMNNKVAYSLAHPNGSTNSAGIPNMVVAYHKVEMTGHPSKEFLKSIDGGVLESIELIDKKRKNLNWDTNGNTKEVSRSVMLRVGPKGNARNHSRVKEAAELAFKRKYDEARVRFRTKNGILSTVVLETETMQFANETVYVKKEKISGFTTPIDSSSTVLNGEIVEKMAYFI